jgi:hypothetical protein
LHNPQPTSQFAGVDRTKELNHTVDLIVVLGMRKARQLGEKSIWPWGLVRHVDLATLKLGALP